ncbi:MAG TPA: cysteine desulfurase [Thermodesulfobacteriota bacterium]|nr:cysteine desulfurase [Thermodesulfobacteriota bacterium]
MGKTYPDLTNLDPYEVREDFPILKRKIRGKPLIYLDNAATTQKPMAVIEAEKRFYEETNANIHRAVHTLSYESTVLYEEAHKKAAEFIGAKSWREVIFTRNATESINLVAYGWGLHNLKEGDEVLITIMEHHSDIVPWQMLRDLKGIRLRFLDVDDEGKLKLEELPRLLTERTKLVAIIHASNVLGVLNPIKHVIEEAKRVGALTLLDAAQSVPHVPINVTEIGCDFLVASGHKMLAPTGIGFLYSRRELLESMEPFLYGGDMIETVTVEKATWNELPWKYEAGTPNIAGGIGLGAAIDYLSGLGMERIVNHERELLNHALRSLSDFPWVEVYGPKEGERVGVVSFNVRGVHPHDIAGVLDEEGIAVRSGHHCAQPLMRRLRIDNAVRVSFYIYNTMEEIDRFIEILRKAGRVFGV